MSGGGVVLSDEDATEVARRNEALQREMAPKSEMGAILILQIATSSVRMERSARQEFAASAEHRRNACEKFDEARVSKAEALMEALSASPRGNLRRLKKSPEGIELLVDAWRELRSDLTRPFKPLWTASHLMKAASMLGIREEDARGSRIGVLSDAIWGDFGGLGDLEGGDLEDEARRSWARGRVVEIIDRAFGELEKVGETIDFETIDLDRAEAPERALIDTSKEGILARRYESDASRRFYKSLKEFREVEAQAAQRAAAPPIAPSEPPLGSFCEDDPDLDSDPLEMVPEHLWPHSPEVLAQVDIVRSDDGTPITANRRAEWSS